MKLIASDPEPRPSKLAAYFEKMARERKADSAARKLAKHGTAADRAFKAEIRKEERRPLVAHHAGKRRAAKLDRTPAWANLDAIRTIYERAKLLTDATGIAHHVDHEIPLQGRKVSGLHVENNLRVITATENLMKHNAYTP